ncbi:MAG: SH3 domain-containing protein [bacterium]|nr:SH3 domain-containing protein [bacterium]
MEETSEPTSRAENPASAPVPERQSSPPPTPPTQTPYPALRKESSGNFFTNRLVQILGAILLGIAIFLSIIFFINQSKKTRSNKSTTQATESAKAQPKKEEKPKTLGYVKSVDGLNLREEPTTASRLIQTLPNGTTMEIISEQDKWYLVEATTRGYVAKKYVTSKKPKVALKIYSFDELNFKFIYPESYKIELSEGDPNTFQFSAGESSGGFGVRKEKSGISLSGYLASQYPKATASVCDITFGNARECRKVKNGDEEFYMVNASGSILKFTILVAYGNFPLDFTNTIVRSMYFPE